MYVVFCAASAFASTQETDERQESVCDRCGDEALVHVSARSLNRFALSDRVIFADSAVCRVCNVAWPVCCLDIAVSALLLFPSLLSLRAFLTFPAPVCVYAAPRRGRLAAALRPLPGQDGGIAAAGPRRLARIRVVKPRCPLGGSVLIRTFASQIVSDSQTCNMSAYAQCAPMPAQTPTARRIVKDAASTRAWNTQRRHSRMKHTHRPHTHIKDADV